MVLDNYRNAWLGMGFTEADLSNGGSDAFIDAMMLWGTADQVKDGSARAFRGRGDACRDPTGARHWRYRRARCNSRGARGHVTAASVPPSLG